LNPSKVRSDMVTNHGTEAHRASRSSRSVRCASLDARSLVTLALLLAAALPEDVRAAPADWRADGAMPRREETTCPEQGTALMQGQRRLSRLLAAGTGGSSPVEAANLQQTQAVSPRRQDSCAELENKGTHFTVKVGVGNPAQPFDVVTDTGSNALIIRSCVCQERGGCNDDQGRCFTGTKKSSTFALPEQSQLSAVVLTFGSGKIEAVVATDDVQVGDKSARMQDALLLMVRRQLDLTGPFEGILGLGLPSIMGNDNETSGAYQHDGVVMNSGAVRGPSIQVKGFMELSGTQAFSVCFNDGANGVLRMDPPEPPAWLSSVGQSHWGLDFRGIAVHSETLDAKVDICSADQMLPGQKTPCGAIPDSGTTVIMAPATHIKLLFEAICKAWPRCQEEATGIKEPHKVMQALLFRCEEWLSTDGSTVGSNAGEALNKELPSLNLQIADANGQPMVLTLDPVDYIMETVQDQMHFIVNHLTDVFPTNLLESVGMQKKACAPAFGVMDFDTKLNGPVWILGTPIFYKYQVGYNMVSAIPGISFVDDQCGFCSKETVLVSQGNVSGAAHGGHRSRRAMRQVHGPLRVSNFDKSKGL